MTTNEQMGPREWIEQARIVLSLLWNEGGLGDHRGRTEPLLTAGADWRERDDCETERAAVQELVVGLLQGGACGNAPDAKAIVYCAISIRAGVTGRSAEEVEAACHRLPVKAFHG